MFGVRYPWIRHGVDVHCQWSTMFWSPHRHIVLGSRVGIGPGCYFLADTEIGDGVLIGPNVAFLNRDDHRTDVVGTAIWDAGRGDKFMVRVEDDVWIGHGAIILSPSIVGRGAVVAAGSVVTRDVAPYSIVAGNPAKQIRMRFSPDEIREHEKILTEKGAWREGRRSVGG